MVDLIDPRGEKTNVSASSVEIQWPRGLVGQRIGFFGNGKSNVEGFFSKWTELAIHEGAVDTLTLMKEGPMAAGGAERYQKFKEVTNLVVVGVCDGGTAASQGAIDAATLAELGVPTILICTDAFAGLAKVSLPEGCDGVRVMEMPHPLSSLTSRQTDELAMKSFVELKSLLATEPEVSSDGNNIKTPHYDKISKTTE